MPEGTYNHRYSRKLMMLVGNIGSGKSTYIKNLNGEYVVLSRDKIRYMIGNGEYIFSYKLEGSIWQAEITLFKELIQTGVNIVIDEVNTNKNMRGRYIHTMLASTWDSNKYEITAVVLPRLSKKESVNRRLKDPHGNDPKHVWESVWEHFNEQYVEPTLEEGFDKIIVLDTDYEVLKEIKK